MPDQDTAFPGRPGNPYPAAFRVNGPTGTRTLIADMPCRRPANWTMSPCRSQDGGNRTHVLRLPKPADCLLSYILNWPPHKSQKRERCRLRKSVPFPVRLQPLLVRMTGIEPACV